MSVDRVNVSTESSTAGVVRVPMIHCDHVTKIFSSKRGRSDFLALDNVSFDVADGEVVALLGPSGCGKSTLLFMMAGFTFPTTGQVLVGGQPVTGPSPEKGVVFQEYALFPWLRVRKNVEYGLRERGVPSSDRKRIVDEMLALTGLDHLADHYPSELSGGLKQRVALARVLANDPKIMLLDEPFGALDEQRRTQLQDEFAAIHQRNPKTAVFVTHSIEEAIFLGDRIVVMTGRPGRVGSVIDVDLARPRDRTSDDFNSLRRVVSKALWQGEN